MVRALRIVFASCALLAAQNIAMAQNYLSRPVVIAVPFAADNADLSATGSPPAIEQRTLDGIAHRAGPINVVGFQVD